ncbi:MAG: citrate/2-methylcitrate synthase, partial [Planctomycetota bacterium]|nr:citrate/2-methylcitrate synthase [Planctomycetota bacterium]
MPHSSSDQKDAADGLAGVTAGQTSICSLEKTLRYRGYAVSDLVLCSFEEVAHLLLWGDLPTLHQLEAFTERIQSAAGSIPETVVTCFQKLAETSPSSSIMDVLRTGVSILGQLDCDNGPMELPNSGALAREYMKAEKLLGQLPALL